MNVISGRTGCPGHLSIQKGCLNMAVVFDPFRELDRALSGLAETSGPRSLPIDLYRQGDSYVIDVDIPGVDPKSIDVDVDGRQLSISAERKPEVTEQSGTTDGVQWIRNERTTGSYLRQLQLGDGLDLDRIQAHAENGVLTLTIPVSEQAKPRKISVDASTEHPEVSVTEGATKGVSAN